jgi:malonate transporter and related proteins
MLETILGAVLPMVVTLLLGFVAARRRDFGPEDVSILNRMVLGYAVPLALFAGTVATSRAELTQVVPLVIALCVAIVGLYVAVFLSSHIAFHLRISTSALAALTASAPAVPFMGPAVLGDLFGGSSAIPIAIASLVINLAVLPVTILLFTLDIAERGSQGGINWSSQHNREECSDGRETAVGSSVTGQVEVARAAGDGAT